MVTISPTLEDKIKRRSRRAFSRFDEGPGAKRYHRISSVDKVRLKYRIPRSGRKTIEVVRDDSGEIVVDPPTTGQIDILVQSNIKRLKNQTDKIHIGPVTAYMLTTVAKKIGKQYKKSDILYSRERCVSKIKRGERVFIVEVPAGNIDDVDHDHIMANGFTVVSELDPEKDLGFTTGLYDCRLKTDVAKLAKRKHLGKVRAYKYVSADLKSPTHSSTIQYEVGKEVSVKDANTDDGVTCAAGINLGSADWCGGFVVSGQRALAFEFEMEDIAAVPSDGGKFRVHRCDCVEEVDIQKFEPIKAPLESNAKSKKKKKKKKGFMDKLLGRGDDED